MDGAQVGVLEERHGVRLGGLLQRQDGGALEAEVALEILRDLAHQALEWERADQEVRGLLVAADLAERDGARSIAVRSENRTDEKCCQNSVIFTSLPFLAFPRIATYFFTPPVAGADFRAAILGVA